MDHIPRIQTSKLPDIRVKNLCKEPYDGLEFTNYPFRKGWCRMPGGTPVWDERPQAEQWSFIQTWLFFGMLDQVFGRRIALADFVDSDGYITTIKLEQFTMDWYDRLRNMSARDRFNDYIRSQACLGEARSQCIFLLDERTSSTGCPLTPEIRLSIKILGESLSNTAYRILRVFSIEKNSNMLWPRDLRGKWGYSTLLVEELLARGWCPSEIAFLQHYPPSASNSGMYYARQIGRMGLDHSRCSKEACLLNVIDKSSYVQQHCRLSSTTCKGSCQHVTPSQERVRAILMNGGVPLLESSTTTFDLGKVNLEVVEYQEGMEYIALSHVWSDGFGNPKSNSILGCQAAYLVRAIADTRKADCDSMKPKDKVLFWIDTLLVPTGEDRTSRTAKKLALDRMAQTYQKASTVLVVSKDLYQQSPSDDLEAAIELLCSKWMRRLWTLQEGVLGSRRLQVIFKHGPVDISRIIENLDRHGHDKPSTEHAVISFATRSGPSRVARSVGRSNISWIVRDLNWRSTSVATDEALVFANLIGLGSHALLQVPPHERMKTAVRLAKAWPSRTLFAPGPRFHEEGYRWALRTFLFPSNFTFAGYLVENPNFDPEKGPLGITVTFPGYIINEPVVVSDDFLLFDHDKRLWLSVRRPLEPLHDSLARRPFDTLMDTKNTQASPIGKTGLIVIHEPWISKHSYGALVSLDEFGDAGPDHRLLSGTHQGVFDVLLSDLGPLPLGKTGTSSSSYTSDRMLKQQRWVIR